MVLQHCDRLLWCNHAKTVESIRPEGDGQSRYETEAVPDCPDLTPSQENCNWQK